MNEQITKLAYSVEEAALLANIGRDKVYSELRNGRLQAKKAGRRTIIPAEALRRYIDDLPPLKLAGADA